MRREPKTQSKHAKTEVLLNFRRAAPLIAIFSASLRLCDKNYY
jgi:hypothetical protein